MKVLFFVDFGDAKEDFFSVDLDISISFRNVRFCFFVDLGDPKGEILVVMLILTLVLLYGTKGEFSCIAFSVYIGYC